MSWKVLLLLLLSLLLLLLLLLDVMQGTDTGQETPRVPGYGARIL